MASIAVDVMLAAAVAGVAVCVLGVVVMKDVYDRLHYACAASTVPAFLVLAAVLVREHLSSGGLEAIGAVGLLFILNPLIVTATARAARRIDVGDVVPREERGSA